MKLKKEITRRSTLQILALGSTSILSNPMAPFNLKPTMNKRLIPTTNEQLPVIGLGTWQTFDVGKSEAERAPLKEVLNTLIEHGGSLIDSSPMYGQSEKVVGELKQELKIHDKIFEATKVWTSGRTEGIQQMETSMNLMHSSPMDLMQIHNLVDWKTHLKTLQAWKAEGRIRYIGITHYHSGGYDEVERIMKNENIDFVQINYNLRVRDAAKRILPLAKDKGIAVLINRPYEGGALFRAVKNKTLPPWAAEFEAKSWGQFFLKFILSHPAVTCVIPGTSKAKHMLDNVQAGFGTLPNQQQRKKIIDFIKT